jgi:predicted acyl esterase
MIPMWDGVRLETVILSPRGSHAPLPIRLERTSYGAPRRETVEKAILLPRGRSGSEGRFVMQRPPRDPRDAQGTGETTGAWDAVDWLIKNVPANNGRAGTTGTSYSAWTAAAMAAIALPIPP